MVNGPSWKTGLMLMVITPMRPGASGITVAMMIAGGALAHLEHPVSLPGSSAEHCVALAGEPGRERVGAEMSLHHQVRRPVWSKPWQPLLQQTVEWLLAQPDRRIRIDGGEGDVARNVLRGHCGHICRT